MKRIALFAFFLLLAACSTIDKREPIATSDFEEANSGIDKAEPSVSPIATDRLEFTGDSIPAGTRMKFALLDPISSATANIGDSFRLLSRTTIVVNGTEVLPSGMSALGEVIHADGKGMLGKPGELLLKLRTLNWQGRPIKLRNSVAGLAKDKTATAMVISQLFGLAGFFVSGNEVEIPVDTIILGDLAESITVTANAQETNTTPQTETK